MDWLTLIVGGIGVLGTIVGSILGARVGGKYVKDSVMLSAEINRKDDQTRERQEIINLRKALLAEIDTLMVSYMFGVGNKLQAHQDNEPFYVIYPVYQRYFVIFEENAHVIGKIPDDKERELVVQCYTTAK